MQFNLEYLMKAIGGFESQKCHCKQESILRNRKYWKIFTICFNLGMCFIVFECLLIFFLNTTKDLIIEFLRALLRKNHRNNAQYYNLNW